MKKLFYIFLLLFISINSNSQNYLTFTAKENNISIELKREGNSNPNIEYSIDNGVSWITLNNEIIYLENDQFVLFRGLNSKFSTSSNNYSHFLINGKTEVSGTIMSLLDNIGELTDIPNNHCFRNLFEDCIDLLSAPTLSATSLKANCYNSIFKNCINLKYPPELPALSLEKSCYESMFYGCENLISAPNLPANQLAESCYKSMFCNCISLKESPNLNSKNLVKSCYSSMFEGCSNLSKIYVDFEDWGESFKTYTNLWVKNVSENGIFICPSNLTHKFSTSNIPNSWLINPYSIFIDDNSKDLIYVENNSQYSENETFTFEFNSKEDLGFYPIIEVLNLNSNDKISTDLIKNKCSFLMPSNDVKISISYLPNIFSITTNENIYCSQNIAKATDTVFFTYEKIENKIPEFYLNKKKINIANYDSLYFIMPTENIELSVSYKDFYISDVKLLNKIFCPNSDLYLDLIFKGDVSEYQIIYSDNALNFGFINNGFQSINSENSSCKIIEKIPKSIPFGIYDAKICVKTDNNFESNYFDFQIPISYSNDIIEIKYNDILCINNSDNLFTDYQWYKNNNEIFGATNQFYFDENGLFGSYSAIITTIDNQKLKTCDIEILNSIYDEIDNKIIVYPNPAKNGELFTISLDNFSESEIENSQILIYNLSGSLVKSISKPLKLNVLTLKSGIYNCILIINNTFSNFKFIIE